MLSFARYLIFEFTHVKAEGLAAFETRLSLVNVSLPANQIKTACRLIWEQRFLKQRISMLGVWHWHIKIVLGGVAKDDGALFCCCLKKEETALSS